MILIPAPGLDLPTAPQRATGSGWTDHPQITRSGLAGNLTMQAERITLSCVVIRIINGTMLELSTAAMCRFARKRCKYLSENKCIITDTIVTHS